MITEIKVVSEMGEATAMARTIEITDEIKRNHLQPQEIQPISDNLVVTDFTIKFARLKKTLRKRSSNIF